VARLAADTFLIVTGTAQATRDADWIRRQMPAGAGAVLNDVTADYAVIAVAGPRSRELLARVSGAAFDNTAFPFGTIRETAIGGATLWTARRSYVGELGWELYVPTDAAGIVYDRLTEAGATLGVRDAGYYALESLRLEKGYRAWGRELTPDYTPYEAGLGSAVKPDKADFLGRAALLAARERPPACRLVSFVACEPETPLAHGGEPILRDGEPVGEVTSAAYGHTLGALVALGYVETGGAPLTEPTLAAARFELDVAGERVAVRASLAAPYDPKGERMRS
jgi:glycine cleavage system aminomethyltransferase T